MKQVVERQVGCHESPRARLQTNLAAETLERNIIAAEIDVTEIVLRSRRNVHLQHKTINVFWSQSKPLSRME